MSKKKIKTKEEKRPNRIRSIYLPFLISFVVVLAVCFLISAYVRGRKQSEAQKKVAGILKSAKPKDERLMSFVEQNNILYIDPTDLLTLIDLAENQIVIVDLRDSTAYKKGHIRGSINISSADILKKTSVYKGRKVIVYGSSAYSMEPEKAALTLMKAGITVKILTIGWNEFRHFSNIWIPEDRWGKLDITKYIED